MLRTNILAKDHQWIGLIARSSLVQGGGLLATTLVGVLLAKGLGLRGYGEYGIAFAIITLLSVPGELGLPKLVLREVASSFASDRRAPLFGAIRWASRTAILIGTAIAICSFVALWVLGADSPVGLCIAVGLPLIPLAALAAIRLNALMGLRQFVRAQLPTLLLRPVLFSFFLVTTIWWENLSPARAMELNVVSAVLILLLAEFWLRKYLPEAPAQDARTPGAWLRTSVSISVIDGLRVMQGQIGLLAVGFFATPEQAGLYRVASVALLVVSVPLTLVETLVSPQFAALNAANANDSIRDLSNRATVAATTGVLFLTICGGLFGKFALAHLFGDAFVAAYLPFLVLCGGQLISALLGMNASLLLMTGREKMLTKAVLVGLTANALCLALFVPFLGVIGAALGNVVYIITWNVVAWHKLKQSSHIDTSIMATLAKRGRATQ